MEDWKGVQINSIIYPLYINIFNVQQLQSRDPGTLKN